MLLLTAVGAHFIGSRPGSEASIPERKAAQDPATMEGVKFLPPDQRELFVGARDFVRPPVRHPLTGMNGRNILEGLDDGPEPPILSAPHLQNASANSGRLLDLDSEDQKAEEQRNLRELSVGPGTGRSELRTARVRERDNLTKIAARELGNGARWIEIAKLNQISKPYHVQVGQLLYLPGEQAVAQVSPTRTPAGSTPSTYKVKAGDTPGEISQTVYGTSKHWKSILSANGIGDARGLKVGTVLKIPSRLD
ncbi:MAG: LysM peptidoglycan-binding domain-containing protein [Planctomycetes bacterium]|nr:LysM peptidoglycan-binding domain-containing protein [Planctomycetota bacterium]